MRMLSNRLPAIRFAGCGLAMLGLLFGPGSLVSRCSAATIGGKVEFNRDIRPILSDRCFSCHGPDAKNRKTKLRLDTEAGALIDLPGGRKALVPNHPEQSELIRRVTSETDALRMPPVYSGLKLTDREIDLLTRWVEQGAEWQGHWAFLAPKRPGLPPVENKAWPVNEIDRFVLARLEREGLHPSPEADRERLIRRVSLDLTGIPPTPQEVAAFLNDTSPQAYETVVDRLLASPRYGERMAAPWLAAARYADTNGYQTDGERYMWRWRDWVIRSFDENKPWDRFAVEQIAGDLLPNATLDQKIASGFNRNHRGNGEGGIIPEEYAAEYVVDRVDTTSTVFLGVTLGCARCHDHKYDPFTQKEFYQLFAYFNNVPERGNAFKYGNSPPLIPAPTREEQAELRDLDRRLEAAEQRFHSLGNEVEQAQRKWEKSAKAKTAGSWAPQDDLVAAFRFEDSLRNSGPGAPPEAAAKDGAVPMSAGPDGKAAQFDGKAFLDAGDIAKFDFRERFSIGAWIRPESPDGAIVSRALDEEESQGYGLFLKGGRIQINMVNRWLDDCLRLESEQPVPMNEWHHVLMTYDGTRLANGVNLYLDGRPFPLKVVVDVMNQQFTVKDPLRIGAGSGLRFKGSIDEVRIFSEALTPQQAEIEANAETIGQIAAKKDRSEAEARKLRLYFLTEAAPPVLRSAWSEAVDLRRARRKLVDSFPSVMVMEEMNPPRETHVLVRGAYDRPGDKVEPNVPSVLPSLPEGAPNNRLGLAQWLVDERNPLMARVTVNRFWQMYFGTGIVKTVEDFGSQGEWPSHPDLLDWLAVEFRESGWNVKALHKKIVMSATYRQTAKVTQDLLQRDPDNRLMARGPRIRLEPEMVRDQALAVSGLLVENVGGPSVKPYQPKGLWSELSGGEDYVQDHGDKLYRRSLYTFWKRAVPPPSMVNFDASAHESCVVRQTRTNTPLQALDLMNNVTYVEASRKMAERMMREGGNTPEARIAYGFRLVTARQPGEKESAVLLRNYHRNLDFFTSTPEAAAELLATGESARDQSLDPKEAAAYANVASLILNLDEAITKE